MHYQFIWHGRLSDRSSLQRENVTLTVFVRDYITYHVREQSRTGAQLRISSIEIVRLP